MRVFSNTHLHWSEVQILKCVTRYYPGHIMNLYLFRIQRIAPTTSVETHSPLEILEMNRPYYCYHTLGFRRTKTFARNTMYEVDLPTRGQYRIHLPSSARENDILAVRDTSRPKPVEIFLPGMLLSPPSTR
jgi:hypothetical protein